VDSDTTDLMRVADLFPNEPLHIVRQSAQRYLQQRSEKFDIIYMDPPWDQPHLYAAIMTQLETHNCIQPNGRLVVEATKRFEFPVFYGQQPQRIYRYGQAVVGVYQR
jgi:16S rRNA G966 N2-methylase RsmD